MEVEIMSCNDCSERQSKQKALRNYSIVVLHSQGICYNTISSQLNVNKGQIAKIYKKFHQHSDIQTDLRKYNSRQTKLNDDYINFIKQLIQSSNNRLEINLSYIQEQLQLVRNIDMCQQTILNNLQFLGQYRLLSSIPCLSLKNQQKRLEFCNYHKNDTFSNVFFADESSFQLYQYSMKIFQFYDEKQLQKTNPNPNPNYSILIWTCICRRRKLGIQVIEGTINTEKHITILQNYFPNQANKVYGENNWRFQQDNAPSHKSYKAIKWLKDNTPRLIKHPPQSPDGTNLGNDEKGNRNQITQNIITIIRVNILNMGKYYSVENKQYY